MFRKLDRKTFALAASLVFAGGAISGTAASAHPGQYSYFGPECWAQVASDCTNDQQALGYGSIQVCAQREGCIHCDRDGHDCFEIDYWVYP